VQFGRHEGPPHKADGPVVILHVPQRHGLAAAQHRARAPKVAPRLPRVARPRTRRVAPARTQAGATAAGHVGAVGVARRPRPGNGRVRRRGRRAAGEEGRRGGEEEGGGRRRDGVPPGDHGDGGKREQRRMGGGGEQWRSRAVECADEAAGRTGVRLEMGGDGRVSAAGLVLDDDADGCCGTHGRPAAVLKRVQQAAVPQAGCCGVAHCGDGGGFSWQAVWGRRRWHCAHAGSTRLADLNPPASGTARQL